MFGTALTSYMCTACFAKQLEQEEERAKNFKTVPASRSPTGPVNQNALYGAGKSVFYAHSDSQSYAEVANIPVRKPPTGQTNGTLYLSNSIFYGESAALPLKAEKEEKIVFEKINVNVIGDKQKNLPIATAVEPSTNREDPVPTSRSGAPQSTMSNKSNLPAKPISETVIRKETPPVPAPRTRSVRNGQQTVEQQQQLVTDLNRSPSTGSKTPVSPRPTELQSQNSIPAEGTNQSFPVLSKSLSVEHSVQPNSRLLSHYDSIRKPCKSNGCSDFGQASTNVSINI